MGPFITALTLQTTAMSGYMFMGGPSLAYQVGWFAVFYAVGDAGGAIINVGLLAKRMRRLSQNTAIRCGVSILYNDCKAANAVNGVEL